MDTKSMAEQKVAIVHDWLTNIGGAERVVDALAEQFSSAPIYTSVYDERRINLFKNKKIITSFLQHWPLAKRKHQLYPLLRRYAFESFNFADYDVVITSASAEAKGVITPTETIHIAYIHTPTRYYWSGYKEYLANPGLGVINPIAKRILPKMINKLRYYDYAAAQRADIVLANSKTVSDRIKKYYNRDSQVISPPVDTERFRNINPKDEGYYLVVSRLIPYKRIDLAVRACNELGKALIVVGNGSELKKLKSIAGSNIIFIENASDSEVTKYVKNCHAFLFPGNEDFGITPVEAMAAGKPVIAYNKGGAAETIVDGKCGILFNSQNVKELKNAIIRLESVKLSQTEISIYAQQFSIKNFQSNVQKVIDDATAKSKV
jgi:glycosyltransferase involved in cell wall biosynthesis